jgi:NAD-dependent dihydropyrimidine dehydrogenase PreA subunit
MKKENGKKLFQFLPLVPGIMEYQFMKGTLDEHSKKIAVLYRAYIKVMGKAFASPAPPKLVASAPARKIPVNKGVTTQAVVMPYKVTKQLILGAQHIAAGACMCRHQGALLDRPCASPSDNCMLFGETARFAAERGFAKALTKDQAIKMIDAAEKAGLVHQYSYIPDHDYAVLCNCCKCHCSIMKGASLSPVPSQALTAGYVIKIDDDACTGCESCIDRCLMAALKMVDGKLTRNEQRCIGCGLCMYVCPAEALSVDLRSAARSSPS